MRDFFCRWRRSLGVVTLVIALVTVGAWIRSIDVTDWSWWWTERSSHTQYSADGHFSWRSQFYERSVDPRTTNPGTWRQFSGTRRPKLDEPNTNIGLLWNYSFSGFRIRKSEILGTTTYWLKVPYWLVATPLTLLSASLILWKPRKRGSQDASR